MLRIRPSGRIFTAKIGRTIENGYTGIGIGIEIERGLVSAIIEDEPVVDPTVVEMGSSFSRVDTEMILGKYF